MRCYTVIDTNVLVSALLSNHSDASLIDNVLIFLKNPIKVNKNVV